MPAATHIAPSVQPAHVLHAGQGIWEESNCYLDVMIELLHARGLDPLPGLAVTLSCDWEGDQWTFCKFNHEDLRELYGLDIQELNPWDDLHRQVGLQVKAGNPVLIEVDAWFLPDTRGSSYRQARVKTTIAVMAMNARTEQMDYLHGTGAYRLEGEDYRGLWRLDENPADRALPPYVERVRIGAPVPADLQVSHALRIFRRELARVPATNPVKKFSDDLANGFVSAGTPVDLGFFHRFAFATFRQIGACSEFLALHLGWLRRQADLDLRQAEHAFLELSRMARTQQFQCARSFSRGRPPTVPEAMAQWWQDGVDSIRRHI